MKEYIINAENEGQRFDKYLGRILGECKMSFIYKMLRKKNFVLNDKKADGREILKSGDCVKIYLSDETFDKFKTRINSAEIHSSDNFKNLIIYEDKDILLINKPSGMLSQKTKQDDVSVNEKLLGYLFENGKVDDANIINYRPSAVNRLDRNTTGLLICAKTLKAAQVISAGLKDRSINKYYQCAVLGTFKDEGKFSGYLKKNPDNNTVTISKDKINDAEYIETEYKLLNTKVIDGIHISYVKVHLLTGKSHQIRAHLSYLGYPIAGDPKYGDLNINRKLGIKKQQLHAYRLEFPSYPEEYGFEFSNCIYECNPDFSIK